jgi:hypothetical protein
MHEHDEPSKRFPVVNLSLGEEDVVPYASRDEDVTRKLFGDLNCVFLGSPNDGNVIVISDSEEEEVHEDDRVDADVAPFSLRISSAPSTSNVVDDDAPDEVQDDSCDNGASDWVQNDSSDGEDRANTP